jgi:hypothetical protein
LLGAYVELLVGLAGKADDGDSLINVLEGLAEIDAGDGNVGVALPRAHHRLELDDLGVRAGLVAIEPRAAPLVALVLNFAAIRGHAPAASVFLREGQTNAAVVRHVAASVYRVQKKKKKKKKKKKNLMKCLEPPVYRTIKDRFKANALSAFFFSFFLFFLL